MVGKLAGCFLKLTLELDDSLCVVYSTVVRWSVYGMAMCNLILLKCMLADARE